MLSHLGIQVPVTELDILASPPETRRPAYLAKNANGRIPLLELDDGSYLAESNAILYFLATGLAGGAPYLPVDALGRARALQWMFFEQYSHEPYVAVLKFWTLWGGLHNKRPEDIAVWKQRGQAALDVMEDHLAGQAWFTGERYGIADIALFAYTQSAASLGFAVAPQLAGWLDRVRAQPGYVEIKPDPTRR
jgi:glutathione S-transferase